MIRIDPSLRLARLVVIKHGHRVYDERFHPGVNMIRSKQGVNSAGKSTVADLIFFALGGDLLRWKDEAATCDATFAEVTLNGVAVTLKREIPEDRTGRRPMSIFIGDLETAKSAIEGWQKYPYQRYGDKESFTQVLFRLLGLPELEGDAASNITIHQLLRLMYVDQLTPIDRIFRADQNDSPLRREAVGDLLCGVFDARIYPAQLELRLVQKQFDTAESELSGLFRYLAPEGQTLRSREILSAQDTIKAERVAALAKMAGLKSNRFDASSFDPSGKVVAADLKAALDKTSAEIRTIESSITKLVFNREDAAALLIETEKTLAQLKEGENAERVLGRISFSFCPSCFTPIAEEQTDHVCHLCKTNVDEGEEAARYARMRNELELQLKESKKLQAGRTAEIDTLRPRLSKLLGMRERLASEYLSITRDYLTESDAEIEQLSIRVGYLDRELVDLERQAQLAARLETLIEAKDELNQRISNLKSDIERWTKASGLRRTNAFGLVARRTADILALDLQSEEEFSHVNDVFFSFAEDRITINGKAGFSASSLTVIRNAFHLALFWASCEDKQFRYLRFILMDNVEDKGMTEARSRNFQRKIVEISRRINVEHQIIFTTSMPDPSINVADFTVGDEYTFDNKSLKMGTRAGALF